MEKIIQINDMNFSYNNNILLENINLDLYEGDYAALIGPNGCGKSTLLKLVLGELKPDSGNILINKGKTKVDETLIGYVPQMSGETNVTFPITPFEVVSLNVPRAKKFHFILSQRDKRRVKYALEMVNLEEREFYNFNRMSGGERQRVMIAKALVNNPELLIFDEPTAGVDKESKDSLFEILDHLNKVHNKTIFIVTHELEYMKKHLNRLFEIKEKHLQEISEDLHGHL